jgi:medium-chain acyl-[acyl-carrier-protein] hydrolase
VSDRGVNQRLWLKRPPRTTDTRIRMLCFHHAGGNAAMYRDWPNLLPSSIEPIAVQLPGRADRFCEPPYERMAPLVEALVDVLAPVLDLPYVCYGASMGARVSWSLAHVLRARAMPMPRKLYVAGHAAPSLDRTIRGWNGPDEGLVTYMRELGGTPPQVLADPELLRALLPILRADLTVLSTHTEVATQPLDVAIKAFAGTADTEVPPERMIPWAMETSVGFEMETVVGGHFFDGRAQRQVTEVIGQELTASICPETYPYAHE